MKDIAEFYVGSVKVPVNPGNTSQYIPQEQFYIPPPQGYLEKLAYAVAHNLPALLIGETGVGKTMSVRYLASQTNNGLRRVNLNGATTVDEFLGKLLINEQGTYWVNGVLVDAMLAGDWILLDDDRRVVLMEYDGRIVRPHPNFRLFASMNPSEEGRYGGTKTLNEALLDRFPLVVRMAYLPEDEEIEAVISQSGNADRAVVASMVRVARDVRQAIQDEKVFGSFSTRRVVDWARMSLVFDVHESAHYTVLSKLSKFDVEAVEDIIDLYF